MVIFGEALNPELWMGEVLSEDPGGYLVQRGEERLYLRRELTRVIRHMPLSDAAMWERWRREFRRPVQQPADTSRYLRFERPPRGPG